MRRNKYIKRKKRLAIQRAKSKKKLLQGILNFFLFIGFVAFICFLRIYEKTFIPTPVLIALYVVFGVLSVNLTKDLVERDKDRWWDWYLRNIYNFIAFGGIFISLFLFINSCSDNADFIEETYKIQEIEEYAVIVKHEKLIKTIEFKETSKRAFLSADNIRLKLKKGILGYDVILDKTVIIRDHRNDLSLLKRSNYQ